MLPSACISMASALVPPISPAFADPCSSAPIRTDMLPGNFALIGRTLEARRPDTATTWECSDEEYRFKDTDGIEFGALIGADGRIQVFQIAATTDVRSRTKPLPFGLTADDSLWKIVQKLTRPTGFPPLAVYGRESGETILATGNCLMFPSGESGALSIWFGEDGRMLRLQLTVPWEGQ